MILVLLAYFGGLRTASGFYDPGTQRWLNRDPIEESDRLNLYTYTRNNPLYFIDSFGLDGSGIGTVTPPIRDPTWTDSGLNNAPGNGGVSHPTFGCAIGTYTPVTTYQKPCPNGGTTQCWKSKRCEPIGTFPTAGGSSRMKPIGHWVPYERCNDCPCPKAT